MGLIDLTKLTPATFPPTEDDEVEFKSSLLSSNEAKNELNRAASAFANTGGGCFIWGVADETGDPDGGVESTVGRQDLPAWIDKVVHNVNPPPKYDIQLYRDNEGRGQLNADKVIVAVSIHPSAVGPHMANDNRYYIRAGRHTVAANHTLVEALWARRQVQSPILKLVLRQSPHPGSLTIDLGIVNLTNAPAVDVELDLNPKLGNLNQLRGYFPVRLPMVDQLNPFYVHLEYASYLRQVLTQEVVIIVKYKDLAGNQYFDERGADLIQSLPPVFRTYVDE